MVNSVPTMTITLETSRPSVEVLASIGRKATTFNKNVPSSATPPARQFARWPLIARRRIANNTTTFYGFVNNTAGTIKTTAATVWALYRARAGSLRPAFFLPLLYAVWAHVHPGYMAGFITAT